MRDRWIEGLCRCSAFSSLAVLVLPPGAREGRGRRPQEERCVPPVDVDREVGPELVVPQAEGRRHPFLLAADADASFREPVHLVGEPRDPRLLSAHVFVEDIGERLLHERVIRVWIQRALLARERHGRCLVHALLRGRHPVDAGPQVVDEIGQRMVRRIRRRGQDLPADEATNLLHAELLAHQIEIRIFDRERMSDDEDVPVLGVRIALLRRFDPKCRVLTLERALTRAQLQRKRLACTCTQRDEHGKSKKIVPKHLHYSSGLASACVG